MSTRPKETTPLRLSGESLDHRRSGCSCLRCLKVSFIFVLSVTVTAILVLLLVAVVRALLVEDPLQLPDEDVDLINLNGTDDWVERMCLAIRLPTVSVTETEINTTAILEMHQLIFSSFPTVHSSQLVHYEVINTYSLLYTVQGSNPELTPFLLTGHMDVVPAVAEDWDIPPFSGEISEETFINGRGTIDDKNTVMGILEALENLLLEGFSPNRTFYMGFGHDEEVGGYGGAQKIGDRLEELGVTTLEFVLDEGMFITDQLLPGTDKLVALIGVSEKGYLDLQLDVEAEGGHSSIPPAESAIGILSTSVSALEMNPQPSQFGKGPEMDMFTYLAPHCDFLYKLIYANIWLFGPLVEAALMQLSETAAEIRTTTAVTIIEGGTKINVVPSSAVAYLNHRVHPDQTMEEVLQYDLDVIDDDRVNVTTIDSKQAHPVSPYGPEVDPFMLVARSIKQVFKEVVVAPVLMVANTDIRWYLRFTPFVYRFAPSQLTLEDFGRYHGDNERITIDNYSKTINFYYRVMVNAEEYLLQNSTLAN